MKKLALLFRLTAHERRGFLLLLGFIVVVQFVPLFQRTFFRPDIDLEPLVQLEEIKRKEPVRERYVDAAGDLPTVHAGHAEAYVLKPFNPNALPEAQWRMMGFSDKQIRVIKNFESKGGHFYSASDVKKIYSISEADFQRIAPFLRFDIQVADRYEKPPTARSTVVRSQMPTTAVDINTADTVALQALPGIGSVLAQRIVKFRDRLGGFRSIDQLKEVYGLSQETFEKLADRLLLDAKDLRQLSVNQLSEEELARHPYISARDARHIVRYRELHGPFMQMADLEKIYALDADFLLKIGPYLQFN